MLEWFGPMTKETYSSAQLHLSGTLHQVPESQDMPTMRIGVISSLDYRMSMMGG